jgi:hypothetical protein
MPKQPKKRGPGRPRLPKGETKGKIVPIRFAPEDLEKVQKAAESKNQTISQWVRSTLIAALGA